MTGWFAFERAFEAAKGLFGTFVGGHFVGSCLRKRDPLNRLDSGWNCFSFSLPVPSSAGFKTPGK